MKTIEENNRLIAEFMKLETDGVNFWAKEGEFPYTTLELEYRTSWDWLMPVVEKILKLFDGAMNMYTADNGCRIYSDSLLYKGELILLNTTRESTYQAVVQFIEWYNEQK